MNNSDQKLVIDHLNHNTMDNRKQNLKVSTYGKNLINRDNVNKNSTTGIRNVSYSPTANKYLVQFQVNGKNTCFGRYDNFEEAKEKASEIRDKLYKIKTNEKGIYEKGKLA